MDQAVDTETDRHYAVDADGTVIAVGARIRRLRFDRQLTLQDVSGQTGLSASMLSMVERGRTSPSIGTLVAIASALRVQMSDLFDGAVAAEQVKLVRRVADQPVFETAAGVTRRVAQIDTPRGVELVVNEYGAGTASAPAPIQHAGAEYGIVIDGELEIEIAGTVHRVGPGDSIAYDSATPHRITNVGRRPARTVWLNLDR